MSSYILKKEHLPAYLKRLCRKVRCACSRQRQGITLFAPYEEHLELDFASHARLSAKSFFLPQREVMLRYDDAGDGSQQQQAAPDTQQLLFGVKPCDARAIELNARLLVNDPDGRQIPRISISKPGSRTRLCSATAVISREPPVSAHLRRRPF